MAVHAGDIHLQTRGFTDIHKITAEVADIVRESRLTDGMVLVFVPGATASITTVEFEAGAVDDLKAAIERLAPQAGEYRHNQAYGDGNGFSHVRAALLGPSLAIPLRAGQLLLGTWQEIILLCHDNRPRDRHVIVQVMGE